FVGESVVPLTVELLLKTAVAPRLTSNRFCCAMANDVKNSTSANQIPAFFPIKCPHIRSKQPDRLRLLNRWYSPQFSQHVFRHSSINVDHCNCVARFARFVTHPPAERKVGNIDFVFAKNGADFANYAGHIAVAGAFTRFAFSSQASFGIPLIAALRISSVFHSAMWPL